MPEAGRRADGGATSGELRSDTATGTASTCAVRANNARPAWAAKLTPRQWEITCLVGDGLDPSSIADALGLRVQTVRNHLFAIYRRSGIEDRTRLALRVQQWRVGGGEATATGGPDVTPGPTAAGGPSAAVRDAVPAARGGKGEPQ